MYNLKDLEYYYNERDVAFKHDYKEIFKYIWDDYVEWITSGDNGCKDFNMNDKDDMTQELINYYKTT